MNFDTARTTNACTRGFATLAIVVAAIVCALAVPATASAQKRIVDGSNVDQVTYDTRYPWIVSLRYLHPVQQRLIEELDTDPPTDAQKHTCGGSLISPTLVITAAHCVTYAGAVDEPAAWTVLAGRRDLAGTGGTIVKVQQIFVHPSYDNDGRGGADVALVRLAAPVAGVTPLRLVGEDDDALWGGGAGMAVGAGGPWVAGWGARLSVQSLFGPATFSLPTNLHEGAVPIHSDSACINGGGGAGVGWGSRFFDRRTMLCAGELDTGVLGPFTSNGTSPCNGDSGGPLIVADGLGGYRLAGIVSFGIAGCESPDATAVFTRIDGVREWIRGTHVVPPRRKIDVEAYVDAELAGDYERALPGAAGVRGEPVVGNQLVCSPGAWTGPDVRFAYHWMSLPGFDEEYGVDDFLDEVFDRSGRAATIANGRRFTPSEIARINGGSLIAGARSSRYVVRAADEGRSLGCIVTAFNDGWAQQVSAFASGIAIPSGARGTAARVRLTVASKRCAARTGRCAVTIRARGGRNVRSIVRVGGWASGAGGFAVPIDAVRLGPGTWRAVFVAPHGRIRVQVTAWDDRGRRSPRTGAMLHA